LQDGARFPQHVVAVLEGRHAHVGIERGVLRRLLFALYHVDHAQGPVEGEMIGERHHLERARARGKDVEFDCHHVLLFAVTLRFEVLVLRVATAQRASTWALNSSSNPGQPPSTSLRIFSPPSAPMRSNLRCSSSTRVALVPSGTNLT